MAKSQEISVQQKKELPSKEEKTIPSRYYVPNTDIYESEDALTLVMEIPGVEKKDVSVQLENDELRVEGRIDFSKYEVARAGVCGVQCRTLHPRFHTVGQN